MASKLNLKSQVGSLLVEILIASLILVTVGISAINAISTSNILVKNTSAKTDGFLALNAASEILAKTPYKFCTSSISIPPSYQTAIDTFNNDRIPTGPQITINSISVLAKSSVSINRVISGASISAGFITFTAETTLPTWLTPNLTTVSVSGNSAPEFNISNLIITSVSTVNKQFTVATNAISATYNPATPTTATFTSNVGYTKCGSSVSAYETNVSFGEMQWAIQKIDLTYISGNESLSRTIIKNFDARNQSYATGKVALSSSPSTSLSLATLVSCGSPQITATNITLQIGETKTFPLSVRNTSSPYATISGNILYTIGNIDTQALTTVVTSSISGTSLTITAPEFYPSPTRNQPGKVNLEIEAIDLDSGNKYLSAGIGITVNAMKIVDSSTNLTLNENNQLSPRSLVNGVKNPITPEVVSGGCPSYSFVISPSLPVGLSLGGADGSITGIPCDNTGTNTYSLTVSDSNVSRGTNSLSLTITGRAIAPLSGLKQNDNTYKFQFSKTISASYDKQIISLCNPPSGTATYYSVDGAGSALSPPAGLLLNSTTGRVTGKPTGTTSSGKNIWVKVCFGTCTVSTTYITTVPILLEVTT